MNRKHKRQLRMLEFMIEHHRHKKNGEVYYNGKEVVKFFADEFPFVFGLEKQEAKRK